MIFVTFCKFFQIHWYCKYRLEFHDRTYKFSFRRLPARCINTRPCTSVKTKAREGKRLEMSDLLVKMKVVRNHNNQRKGHFR